MFINEVFTCETIPRMHATMVRLYEAARSLKNLETPTDVARALNQSQQTINNWERRGMSRIGMIEAQKHIGCSATWLQTGKGSMTHDASIRTANDTDNGLAERIRVLLDEPDTKPQAVAKAAGVTPKVVDQWLSGEIKTIPLDQAVGIQEAFGYNAVWLVMGKGTPKAAVFDDPRPKPLPRREPKPPKKSAEPSDPTPLTYVADVAKYRPIPVVGRAQGGLPDRIWTDGDYPVGATQQYAEVASADPHAFLTPVVGLSMIPRYNPGEFALVEPGTEPELEDDVLVRLNSGETMIKRLLSRRQGVRLGSYNDPEVFTFDPSDITWLYYVAHPVPARKIKTRL
ncbi:LexA family transcriptional regulator [Cupriavidus sp. TA19]|uniref:LexA family transcriptional regulator n=1 Tax=Cupriavidus sp. TA19 TaxID=701108 RepID=UPI00295E8FDD|nr:S24 family peptidase [Cupriavidus sp. TA19]